MCDRPLYEVVAEAEPSIEDYNYNWIAERGEKWVWRNIGPQLAAVLKAADELIDTFSQPDSVTKHYDAAVADLRRTLEGK